MEKILVDLGGCGSNGNGGSLLADFTTKQLVAGTDNDYLRQKIR
jgi:hypothetical protein